MPAITVSNVEYDSNLGYYINLSELSKIFPHMEKNRDIEVYLIEVRNEQGKLVKRFKPFEKLKLKIGEHYRYSDWEKHLSIPRDLALELNIGRNYRLGIIISKYDNRPILPFELKALNYDSQRLIEFLSEIEVKLLSTCVNLQMLNKALSYLWDAWSRLEENDVEGARMAIRNSLEVMEREFLKNITISRGIDESKDFLDRLRKLIVDLKGFLHYGGPHPGPAPKSSTEMILSLSLDILTYLSKFYQDGIIIMRGYIDSSPDH